MDQYILKHEAKLEQIFNGHEAEVKLYAFLLELCTYYSKKYDLDISFSEWISKARTIIGTHFLKKTNHPHSIPIAIPTDLTNILEVKMIDQTLESKKKIIFITVLEYMTKGEAGLMTTIHHYISNKLLKVTEEEKILANTISHMVQFLITKYVLG